jgi:hypothetical protein
MRTWARHTVTAGQRAYLYLFSHIPPSPRASELRAFHASEIPTCSTCSGWRSAKRFRTRHRPPAGRSDVELLGQLHHTGRSERSRAAEVARIRSENRAAHRVWRSDPHGHRAVQGPARFSGEGPEPAAARTRETEGTESGCARRKGAAEARVRKWA